MDDVEYDFRVHIHGVLSSNAFYNFVNYYKTRKNLEGKPMSKVAKEATSLWSVMSNKEKMPFKQCARAVKKFRARKRKKEFGPYEIIGYQSDLVFGKDDVLKLKEMIAYTHSLEEVNLESPPSVELSSDFESEQS